ncbi:transposon Ty3-I Gag-Pol polyprotein [Elysia marginata]|uniref:Transposon Ty3-I Gag-Pol polyprotein n=1 Tax=Elysia marginata TaxID=1093978 RepID=A0AAV4H719_9GAST|nr:transposon Ty3-I Gag-Pol polyprotein [Elysia marginata]
MSVGDNVFVQNFSIHGGRWLPGMVVESTGPLSYKIKTSTGSHGIVRRHQDQIRVSLAHDSDLVDTPVTNDVSNAYTQVQSQNLTNERLEQGTSELPFPYYGENTNPEDPEEQTLTQPRQVAVNTGNQPYVTRSSRVVTPPVRLIIGAYVLGIYTLV